MTKFLSLFIFSILLIGCSQKHKSISVIENNPITFTELEFIHSKSKTEIEKKLQQHDFKYIGYNNDNKEKIYSWKCMKNTDEIRFTEAAAFQFSTESKSRFDSLVNEIKSKKFISTGVEDIEASKMETYTKDGTSLFTMSDAVNEYGNKLYLISFVF